MGGNELYTGHNFLHEVVHLSCLHKICSMPHRGWLGTLHLTSCYHVVLMLSIVLGAPFMTTPYYYYYLGGSFMTISLLLPGWLTGSDMLSSATGIIPHICRKYHKLDLWRKICLVEKSQIYMHENVAKSEISPHVK